MDNFKSYLAESADAALKKKADKSGFSLSILKQVYKRGVAAWKVGHKPGTTPQQWGMARVNSFITGGRTRVKGDPDLWAKQKGKIRKPKKVEEDVSERTLTPAEKKKREGIAKAMERDNPGMDMGKKMAIATATAKKVAEEVELDEDVTKMTHGRLKFHMNNKNVPHGSYSWDKMKAERDRRLATGQGDAYKKAKASMSEEKDPNEYDREGEMMKGQLRQICSANEKLMKMVGDDDNLPEWVQNKVTKATDYIRSVRDYLESESNKDDMSEAKVDEISLDMLTKKVSNTNMGNVRKAMKTDKVKTDLAMMKKKLDDRKGMKPIKAQTEDVQSADKKVVDKDA